MRAWPARLRRVIANAWIDLHYGRLLMGIRPTHFAHLGAKSVSNSDYEVLQDIFAGRVKPDDVLVDIGCGKGRVLNCWLHMGYRNRMYGLDYEVDLIEQIRKRLRRYPNVSVVSGDALVNLPQDATLFYLFNPFTEPVMQAFKQRLYALYQHRGNVTVLYYNCKYLHVFQGDPSWHIEPSGTLPSRGYVVQQLAVIHLTSSS